ncbi:putative single-strand DNA-binding protein [Staphylococcus gallinarum]|uniref:Putative single-strand DNA-binding protein n=1 Tax=Staphylococcus gallinarum TaxID=1293 RepID=A0A380FCZ9_STAGA|nr:putative single-strand DNA-binding protein [Staphylococcus gallinarum]
MNITTIQKNGNTVLKRFWKFEGTAVFEKYEIKEEQKNNNTSTSSNNSNSDNPFANANGPIDIDESDLPF